MKRSWRGLMFPLLAVLNGGCATVIDGGGQVISINTVPSGADCALVRDGAWIGQVVSTPGSIAVDPSRHTIVVTCAKPGYGAVVGSDAAIPKGEIYGNVLLGLLLPPLGVAGAITDLSTQADYAYGANINVTFPQAIPQARYEPPPGTPRY